MAFEGGMSFFKPGWLYGSNLDNAQVVFTSIIEGNWAVFGGGCGNVIPWFATLVYWVYGTLLDLV